MELGVKDGVNKCHTWFQLQDQSLMLVVTLIVERLQVLPFSLWVTEKILEVHPRGVISLVDCSHSGSHYTIWYHSSSGI
jgi:hypothetical protein